MAKGNALYGVLGRFDEADALLAAVLQLGHEGYTHLDAYSPFPVEGLADALPGESSHLPRWALIGGLLGASASYLLQYYSAVINYPLNIGGRPLHSWPAFIPFTIEFTLLGAALGLVLGLLLTSRLPQLRHPLFAVPGFEAATQDAFFVCVRSDDRQVLHEATNRLRELGASRVQEVMK
jgi:hypothetical protein